MRRMSGEETRTRGRPRRTETDDRIVRATQGLIREQGPVGVNVAAVSVRSGVARTTIYRRYADREALLAAALGPITDRGEPPEGDTVEAKIAWVLERTAEVLDQGIGRGGVASVLADTDPDFSAALRRSRESGLAPILEQIAADVSAGVLDPDVDPDALLNLILGSYLAESLRRGNPSAEWRARTARLVSAWVAGPGER
jgi:AcrR family transcriptional regulator